MAFERKLCGQIKACGFLAMGAESELANQVTFQESSGHPMAYSCGYTVTVGSLLMGGHLFFEVGRPLVCG